MAKKKEVLKEEKKKVPFNVFRKGAAALALAGVMIASPFMFTGCSGEKGEKGDTGVQGEQGVQGKGIADMDIVYEYDNKGDLYAVYTITYTDGTTEEVRSLVPKRVIAVEGLCLTEGVSLDRFAKVDNAANVPQLYVQVMFEDSTVGKVALTNDMFVVDESQDLEIPDFTKKGTYHYKISCKGKVNYNTLEIVDLADYASSTITRVGLNDQMLVKGTALKDITVSIAYDNSTIVYAPLSMVANTYYDINNNETLNTIDTSVVGTYNVTPKDAFKFKENPEDPSSDYAEYIDTLYIYDTNCTVNHVRIDDIALEHGDDDFETKLKAKTFIAYLFEPNAHGDYQVSGTVEDLNYDLTNFDINRVGMQMIPFTYQLEGQTGVYEDYMEVIVNADLSEAEEVGSYTVDETEESTLMMMYKMSYGDTIKLYDNGIAVMFDSTAHNPEETEVQANYELAENGTLLKVYDSIMQAHALYELNDTTDKISFYKGATGTAVDYTIEMEIFGETYPATISVYGTTGTCKAKVIISVDMGAGAQTVPYAFIECTYGENNTIVFGDRTFNILTGNVLEEVTE